MIDVLIKVLRNKAVELNTTADSLERMKSSLGPLFIDETNEQKAVKAITKRMNGNIDEMSIGKSIQSLNMLKNTKAKKQWLKDYAALPVEIVSTKRTNPMKGKTYPKGSHWTQKPENKDRLAKIVRKMVRVGLKIRKAKK